MSELHHECGVAGIYFLEGRGEHSLLPSEQRREVSRLIPRMLLDLQNRGQLAAGISSYNPDRAQLIETYKGLGPVNEALRATHIHEHRAIMDRLKGPAAIGHVRYATCGEDDLNYAQPMERRHGCMWKWFSFCFNGNLANYDKLARELLEHEGYHLSLNVDTEVISHCLAYELRGQRPTPEAMFATLSRKFDGAYNILYLNAVGEMVAFRDPLGIRPLCIGQEGPLVAIASESVALLNLGMRNIRSLDPGELVVVDPSGVRSSRIVPSPRRAHCFFEWIYFANVASELDGASVYQVRSRLGRELARTETLPLDDDTIVVPVPDTAKGAADAMAYELKLPSLEGLMRNRYVGRTFITGADRADKVRQKYTALRHVLQGKKVLLVEDTIVRSTTMKGLISHLREVGGAREVHVRVACPPIVAPCFYGIDMSNVSELFAPRFLKPPFVPDEAALARMAADLEANSLRYLTVDSLARAIGLPERDLCRACVTGDYPTPEGTRLYQISLDRAARGIHTNGRTHENARAGEPVKAGM
jgi:amidophosphoribosyltransferase